jgi:long-subunit acyl-CoA synthetase (AMP-forming)
MSQELPLRTLHKPGRESYEVQEDRDSRFKRVFNKDDETNRIALVMHSSGSAGLPKPVLLSHKNVLCHPV